MTLGTLIFRCEHKSGLNSAVADERTLMVGWANDGVIEVLLLTQCFVTPGDITLTVGKNEYRTDAAILAVLNARVLSSNAPYDLEVVELEQIMSMQRVASSGPVRSIAVEGDYLTVYPTPQSADIITVIYVPRPTAMTADANDPSTVAFGGIPSEYHRAIEYYMLWQAAEYDDKKFAQTPQDLQKQFYQECAAVKRRKRHKRGRTPQVPLIGYPGRSRVVPHNNDVDLIWNG